MFPHEYINAQCKNRSQGNDDEQIPDTTPSKLPSKVIQTPPLMGGQKPDLPCMEIYLSQSTTRTPFPKRENYFLLFKTQNLTKFHGL